MKFFETLKRFGKNGKEIESKFCDHELFKIARIVSPAAVDLMDIVFEEILHKILNSDEYQLRSTLSAEITQLRKGIDYRDNEKSMLECEIADLRREMGENLGLVIKYGNHIEEKEREIRELKSLIPSKNRKIKFKPV